MRSRPAPLSLSRSPSLRRGGGGDGRDPAARSFHQSGPLNCFPLRRSLRLHSLRLVSLLDEATVRLAVRGGRSPSRDDSGFRRARWQNAAWPEHVVGDEGDVSPHLASRFV